LASRNLDNFYASPPESVVYNAHAIAWALLLRIFGG